MHGNGGSRTCIATTTTNEGTRQWGTEVTTTNIREREQKRPYWDVRYGNKIDLYVHKNERKDEAKTAKE